MGAALSSRKTKRPGGTSATASRQARRSSWTPASSRSAARRPFFFSGQAQAPHRPPQRPRVHPHAGLAREPVPVLGEGEVIVRQGQALEHGLAPAPDRRRGPAPRRLGLEPALPAGRADPAVDGRAPGGWPPSSAAATARRRRSPEYGPGMAPLPPGSLPPPVPTSSRSALVVRCRQKIPSGRKPPVPGLGCSEPRQGYQLSASHH